MDHKLKEQFRCKYYGRYMDDFYIFSDSYEELEILLDWIKDYTRSIGLELNPKTAIITGDIDFLGFSFRLTTTGKVVVRMQKSKKTNSKASPQTYDKANCFRKDHGGTSCLLLYWMARPCFSRQLQEFVDGNG